MNIDLKKIIDFEKKTNIKCLHNEIKIIFELSVNGPLESMSIMKNTKASISGHNADMKRLCTLNAIEILNISNDKRKRVYYITNNINNLINLKDGHLQKPLAFGGII